MPLTEVGVVHCFFGGHPSLMVVSEEFVEEVDRLRIDQMLIFAMYKTFPPLSRMPWRKRYKLNRLDYETTIPPFCFTSQTFTTFIQLFIYFEVTLYKSLTHPQVHAVTNVAVVAINRRDFQARDPGIDSYLASTRLRIRKYMKLESEESLCSAVVQFPPAKLSKLIKYK